MVLVLESGMAWRHLGRCGMRGNAAVPKKDLLHELGVRGPTVLIDEYKTSKMCPCGHELCDGKSQHDHNHGTGRVRVHKTIGDDSCEVLVHRNDRSIYIGSVSKLE